MPNFGRVLKLFVSLLSPHDDQGDYYRERSGVRDRTMAWNALKLLKRALHEFLQSYYSSFFGSFFQGHE